MKQHTVITEEIEGVEIELDFEPVSEILSKRIDDKIVAAYLTYDFNPENPMTSWDGEGKLFTKPERCGGGSITDDSGWGCHLGLNKDGEPDLELDAVSERAFTKLTLFVSDSTRQAEFIQHVLDTGQSPEQLTEDIFDVWSDQRYAPKEWSEELSDFVLGLPNCTRTYEICWDELFEEGKIGDYLAIPVNWYSSSAYTTSVDGCNAVWVPGIYEIDNMSFPENATYQEKLAIAYKYAESCLATYIAWCNGDVYGCVVQTYDAVSGEQLEQDSCWGFYGMEYAEEALKSDFFDKVTV